MFLDLEIDKLREFDEVITNEIDMNLMAVVNDMRSRPLVEKARKVVVTFTLLPVPGELNGRPILQDVKVDIGVKPSIPVAKSRVHTLQPSKNSPGLLTFQTNDPDNPRQRSFDDVEEPASSIPINRSAVGG